MSWHFLVYNNIVALDFIFCFCYFFLQLFCFINLKAYLGGVAQLVRALDSKSNVGGSSPPTPMPSPFFDNGEVFICDSI